MGVWSALPGESEECSAARMFRHACDALQVEDAEALWQRVVDSSPPDSVWHSLKNCVAYQAGVWHDLLSKGVEDVSQPAAFKLAIVLRHTPSEVTIGLLNELLASQPQSTQQELTSYVLALLVDEEETRSGGGGSGGEGGSGGAGPGEAVPPRELRLFGDCELAVLAASHAHYDIHAKLVRAEYSELAHRSYVELRLKVLNQFSRLPKLFHTSEFECFESAARENIEREICTLREQLLTGRAE